LLFIPVFSAIIQFLYEVVMGTIRVYKKADGSVTHHAEVCLKSYPSQRASLRTNYFKKSQAF
jgi:hypothetical protein